MSALTDPIETMLAGRADLAQDFQYEYGCGWRQKVCRVRVFRNRGQTLVALTGTESGASSVSRFIDLIVPSLTQQLRLDAARTFWLDHDAVTGCLAVFEPLVAGPKGEVVSPPRWRTFQKGEYHHYYGKDYCQDMLRWLDDTGFKELPEGGPAKLEAPPADGEVIDV